MKKIAAIIFFVSGLSFASSAQTVPASADEVMKEACAAASKENKNVLIMFTASWCGWCHKMDKSINDAVCSKFFEDNYIIRHIVVDESPQKKQLENPGGDAMKKKYYGDGTGIPFWLIFDKDGKLLADSKIRKEGEGPEKGENTGCPATEQEVNYFVSVIQKTSRMGNEELEIVRKRFRRNE